MCLPSGPKFQVTVYPLVARGSNVNRRADGVEVGRGRFLRTVDSGEGYVLEFMLMFGMIAIDSVAMNRERKK